MSSFYSNSYVHGVLYMFLTFTLSVLFELFLDMRKQPLVALLSFSISTMTTAYFSPFISKDMYDKLLLRNAEDISESDTEKKCRSFFPGMTSTITFI